MGVERRGGAGQERSGIADGRSRRAGVGRLDSFPTTTIVPRVAYRRVRRLLAPSSCSATLLDVISGLNSVLTCNINYSVFPDFS